jgi:glycosyltransferase involved in cell wall biosynthesis
MGLHEDATPDGAPSDPDGIAGPGRPVLTAPDRGSPNRGSPDTGSLGEPAGSPVRPAPRSLVINGRFLTQPLTGVQRYAREVVKAMDRLAADGHPAASAWTIEVQHPPAGASLDSYRTIRSLSVGKRSGHLWEQVDLPRAARGRLLLNLANTAPVLHPNIIGTIHDVGVFAHGDAYSTSFRLSYRMMFRYLMRRARLLFTVSAFSAGDIAQYCGNRAGAIAIAPNAADHLDNVPGEEAILDRLGLRNREYVLAVGSRNPLKNVGAAVKAVASLAPDPPPLVLVGQRAASIFQDASVEAADFLIPTGEITDGELRGLYRNALCLVFPTRYEGFGIPPLEAMQEGCPVIASRLPVIREVCSDAIVYCDPDNPEDIAEKIRLLSRDAGYRRSLVEAGRSRAKAFSWEATAIAIFENMNALEPA